MKDPSYQAESLTKNADLSLAGLIQYLKAEGALIDAGKMGETLRRLTLSADEIQPYLRFSNYRYARNLVHKTEQFEIMVMCWHSGQRSSIHDHAGSLGGLKIVSGELTESIFIKAANGMIKGIESVDHTAGATRVETTSLIHQISNLQANNTDAVSLHIYVPPLTRMNVYSLEDPAVKNVLTQYFSSGSGI